MTNASSDKTKKKTVLKETERYQKAVNTAYTVLGKDNVTLIMHGSSFPSNPKEDTGIGTPYSAAGKKLMEFLKTLGFNSIQLGPEGIVKKNDPSPYSGTIFSTNPLFIDLKQLTAPEWANILSKESFKSVVHDKKDFKDKSRSPLARFNYVFDRYNVVLREAFKNFNDKLAAGNSIAVQINKDFEKFKKGQESWLHGDALYEALSKEHGNDHYESWRSELDINLMNSEYKNKGNQIARKAEIEEKYKDDIEFYKFCQFILSKQKQKTVKEAENLGIKTIADFQVGILGRDYWVNQSAFTKDSFMGCPPDYFSETGQAWGFPVLDPAKIFNKDGTQGKAGEFIKRRIDQALEANKGGIRIDHFIGWRTPFVYPKGEGPTVLNPKTGKYELNPKAKRIDVPGEEIIRNILWPSAKAKGVNPEDIIYEDLGALTPEVEKLMKDLNLGGIKVTQFLDTGDAYRGKNANQHDTIMIGSHDNPSALKWVSDLFKFKRNEKTRNYHIKVLSEDLKVDAAKLQDPKNFLKAKAAELFASPARNVQIFFTDFFGMKETYNTPGQNYDQNDKLWRLRADNNYQEKYYAKLAQDDAINLPEVLKIALDSKKSADLIKTAKARGLQLKKADLAKLSTELDDLSKILKQ